MVSAHDEEVEATQMVLEHISDVFVHPDPAQPLPGAPGDEGSLTAWLDGEGVASALNSHR